MDKFGKYCKYNIGSKCQLGYKECVFPSCEHFEDNKDNVTYCEYMSFDSDYNCVHCMKYNKTCDNCR
jgi:hypothetical protein